MFRLAVIKAEVSAWTDVYDDEDGLGDREPIAYSRYGVDSQEAYKVLCCFQLLSNTLTPQQNCDIFEKVVIKYILLTEKVHIPIQIPSKFVFLHIKLSITQQTKNKPKLNMLTNAIMTSSLRQLWRTDDDIISFVKGRVIMM